MSANVPPAPSTPPVVAPETPWEIAPGSLPILATAIHAGHGLRPDTARALALGDDERRREEDPATDRFLPLEATRVVVDHSRFEVDLNRPRDEAFYRGPEQAWGLDPWGGEAPTGVQAASLEQYDAFYRRMERLGAELADHHGRFVVLDVHSYNWRREGPDDPGDPKPNPEVNLGTGNLDREHWAPVVERFMGDLARQRVAGHPLDVRENVRFRGGHFSRWLVETFPGVACPLAIEVRKIYMDEWTGEVHQEIVEQVAAALEATLPGLVEALGEVG